jgi:Lar family restriction alleviation protein
MTNEKLKPCPFCGCKAKILHIPCMDNVDVFQIFCKECMAMVKAFKNLAEAVEAWNRRVNDGRNG